MADEEIIYHESKGLKVIEWNKLFHTSDNYLSRYQTFFSTLKNHSKLILEGKSEDEAFEILYNRLKPLNRLNALRIEDVSKRLSPYVRIGDNGVIFFPKIENRICGFQKEIWSMSIDSGWF